MGSKNSRLAKQNSNKLVGREYLPTLGSMRSTLKQLTAYKPASVLDRQTDDSTAVDYRYLEIAGFLPRAELLEGE